MGKRARRLLCLGRGWGSLHDNDEEFADSAEAPSHELGLGGGSGVKSGRVTGGWGWGQVTTNDDMYMTLQKVGRGWGLPQ